MATAGFDLYKLGMEGSPIILTGGIATLLPGQMLPIIAITESINLINGLLTGVNVFDLNELLCHYSFNPGMEMVKNEVAMYPFANQAVAANSIIQQPKRISLTMTCPAKDEGGMFTKLAALTALQIALETHNAAGGLYTVVTPSLVYTSCIMVSMTGADGGETRQQQYQWQLEFIKPLITASQAATAESSLMSKLTGQTQVTSSAWSAPATAAANTGGVQLPASVASGLPSLQSLFANLSGGLRP